MPEMESELLFPYLQELQIDCSLILLEEEKHRIINEENLDFSGLHSREVLSQPALFRLNKTILEKLPIKLNNPPDLIKDYTDRKKFEALLVKQFKGDLSKTVLLRILKYAVNSEAVCSYWNALRVIAFHSFQQRKIIEVNGELKMIRTRKQFEYYFRSQKDINQLGDNSIQDPDEKEVQVQFDGAKEKEFELFYKYVCQRIQGQLDRQIKRKDKAPLLVWKERFKNDLTVFFKAKVGGNGYAKDYIDSKLRELKKRSQKKLKGSTEADLVRQKFMDSIASDRFSHQEYTCLMALNRGHSIEIIADFTGLPKKNIEIHIQTGIPKAAEIVFEKYCEQYEMPFNEEGLKHTTNYIRQILGIK